MKFKLLILGLTTLIVFASCEKKKEVQSTEILFDGGDSAFVFKNVSTLYSEKALIKLKLEAVTQIQFENQSQLYPEGIYLELFDENGVKTTTLEADWAEYIHSNQKYTAKGNILVKNLVEKQQLETNLLYWDLKKEEIYTDDTVKILTQTEQIDGIGMSAKQDFSQYIIKDPTGVITLPEDFEPSPTPRKQLTKKQPQKKELKEKSSKVNDNKKRLKQNPKINSIKKIKTKPNN